MNRPCRSVVSVPVRSCSLAVLVVLAICRLVQAAEEPAGAKPVLELLFDGNLEDTSGSQRAGTARGDVAFVDGRQGQCASFDGRAWVDTGFPQNELGDAFTVECWVNPGPGHWGRFTPRTGDLFAARGILHLCGLARWSRVP